MGYNTDFIGSVSIEPPLNPAEIEFLTLFSESRRMTRPSGPYSVESDETGSVDYNSPPMGQPSLWCDLVPNEDGTAIEWNGGEKSYGVREWMIYLIDHFLKPGAVAASVLPFLQANHICNGEMLAQGEDMHDRWKIIVRDNVVETVELE